MEMKCTGNCIQCEWRTGKTVDDVLFCQNTQLMARAKSQLTLLLSLEDKINALSESLEKVAQITEPRKLSDFPDFDVE